MNKEELVKLLEESKSIWEAAEKLGVARSTVNYWIKKHGLTVTHPKLEVKDDE